MTVEDAVSAPKKAKEASKGSTGAPVKKAGKQKKAGGAKKGPLLGPAKQPVQKKRRQPSK